MKLAAAIFCAILLGACTQSQDDQARDQARQTAEQVKRDSRVALHQAEIDTSKAGKAIDRGLDKTREKVRGALNEPPDDTDHDKDRR